MDAYATFMSFIFVISSVIIYDVFCVDNNFYGHNNNNSWSLQNQQRLWFNYSSPLNQLPTDNARPVSFNISDNFWPALRTPQASPSNRNNGYPKNNRTNTGSQLSSGPSNNTKSNKTDNNQEPKFEVDDNELRDFSEELFQRDSNNAYRYISVNFQGKTTSSSKDDKAPLPLLTVQNGTNQIRTISKLKRLHNNYLPNVNQVEQVTSAERQEEDDLLNAYLETEIMEYTRSFLIKKGVIGDDVAEFKSILKEMWFTLYSRSNGRLGSSGFEHIFLGEIKNSEVSGLHNWVFFNEQELLNNLNYLGHLKIVNLGDKGHILKLHFKFHDADKPVDSMFIGTSPEFEMALYSTCFLLRPNKVCPLQITGKRFIVRAFTFNYNGKKLVGSAFPEI